MYTIDNAFLRVQISELGAELRSLLGGDGTEYLWQGHPAFWRRSAPVLFPYVGRLTEGRCLYRGVEYRLPIHGFAPDSVFAVEEQSQTAVELALYDSAETLRHYPFHFVLRVRYALEDNALKASFCVSNRGDEPMFFGLGGHPGFNVPLAHGLRFEDYVVEFSRPCEPRRLRMSDDCFMLEETDPFPLVNGRTLQLVRSLFDRDAVVLTGMPEQLTIRTEKDAHAVTVSYPNIPYVGLWQTAHADAPFLCVEPWCTLPARSGITEDLEKQPSLLAVKAGGEYRCSWSVAIAPLR